LTIYQDHFWLILMVKNLGCFCFTWQLYSFEWFEEEYYLNYDIILLDSHIGNKLIKIENWS
jgi:hypothetical protein